MRRSLIYIHFVGSLVFVKTILLMQIIITKNNKYFQCNLKTCPILNTEEDRLSKLIVWKCKLIFFFSYPMPYKRLCYRLRLIFWSTKPNYVTTRISEIGTFTHHRTLLAWRSRWLRPPRRSRRNTHRPRCPGAPESAQFATPSQSRCRQPPCQRSRTCSATSTPFSNSSASRWSAEDHRGRHSRKTPRRCSSPAAVSASLSAREALRTQKRKGMNKIN